MFKTFVGKLTGIKGQQSDSFLSGSAVYVVSTVFNAAIPFFLLPVLTRFLTPAEYGLVGMYSLTLSLLGAFTGLSLHGAANRKYFDRDSATDIAAYISCCITLILLSTSLVLVAVYVFREPLHEWTGLSSQWLLLAVPASAMVYAGNIRLGQWQVRKQSVYFGIFQVSRSAVNAALSLLFVVSLSLGLEGQLWGQTLALVLFGVGGLWLLYKEGLLKLRWRNDYFREALAFGVPLIPHIFGLYMLTMLDRVVVKHFLGLSQTGVYMVAVQIALGMGLLADAVNKAYVPWLFERLADSNNNTDRGIVRATYAYFGLVIALAIVVALLAPLFVPWFAGPQFQEAGHILRWLALGQAFNAMYLMVTNYVFFSRKTASLSLATISVGVLHILLAIILVQKYDLVGVAVAFTLSMAARFMVIWYLAQRLRPMPWISALIGQR